MSQNKDISDFLEWNLCGSDTSLMYCSSEIDSVEKDVVLHEELFPNVPYSNICCVSDFDTWTPVRPPTVDDLAATSLGVE